jgi:hypothetical protein
MKIVIWNKPSAFLEHTQILLKDKYTIEQFRIHKIESEI